MANPSTGLEPQRNSDPVQIYQYPLIITNGCISKENESMWDMQVLPIMIVIRCIEGSFTSTTICSACPASDG